jgi:hypothetical protein
MILENEYKTVLDGKFEKCDCINCTYNVIEVFKNKAKRFIKQDFRVVLQGRKDKLHLRK